MFFLASKYVKPIINNVKYLSTIVVKEVPLKFRVKYTQGSENLSSELNQLDKYMLSNGYDSLKTILPDKAQLTGEIVSFACTESPNNDS